MSHVIIEGPDGAGKTSLARFICHRHTMAYHHEGPPPDGSALHHYAGLLMNTTKPTVFDRLHLGELVYGPLLRGDSKLAPADVDLLNEVILNRCITVVACLPPWETCFANNRDKDEFIKDEVTLHAAYDAWSVLLRNPRFQVNLRLYDYTASPPFKLQGDL